MPNVFRRFFTALHHALPRPSLRRGGEDLDLGDSGFPRRPTLLDVLTLRPYGRSMLTPAAAVWQRSAWMVILLMASIEGFVWGAVGASLVPSAAPWLRPPVALFMFLLLFTVVWIVDASLIMSERPSFARRRRHAMDDGGSVGPLARWYLGIAARVAIVALSLYVTAPFIEKLIRADDIAAWHQAQVEQYLKQRELTLREQVRARAEQRDAGLMGRIAALEQDIERLGSSLGAERERRGRSEAEFAPQMEVLTRDLAAARERVGDEVLGRDGRPEGYGPEARKWDTRARLLETQLAEVQAQRDARLVGVETGIAELQQRLAQRTDALQQARTEQAALMDQVTREVEAEQPPAVLPKLTFAARSKGLNALRNSPAEAGVPHFETVEGFAQAALGILFFALLALKLFEPPAVHAYYSEDVQLHYRRYLQGGLAQIPGFEQHDDPAHRLSPVGFAQRWQRWERDPDGYVAGFQAMHAAEVRLRRLTAEARYEADLLQRRHDDIDARLQLERRRQEAELAARERQFDIQTREAERRASAETDAELERLAQQREQARKAHATALADMDQRLAAEQADRDAAVREMRIRETRALLEQERDAEARLRRDLAALDARRSQRADRVAALGAELDQVALREQELKAREGALRVVLRGRANGSPGGQDRQGPWLFGGDGEARRRREAVRELKRLERSAEGLRKRREELSIAHAGARAAAEDLGRAVAALEADATRLAVRIEECRGTLDRLLLSRD